MSEPPVTYILKYDGFYIKIIVREIQKWIQTITLDILQLRQVIQNYFLMYMILFQRTACPVHIPLFQIS